MSEEIYSQIKELNDQQEKLNKENEAIHQSIKPSLEANRAARERVNDERSLILGELIKERGLDGFINDIEFAEIAYHAMYSGMGSTYLSDIYHEYVLSEMTYVMSNGYHPYSYDDYSRMVSHLEIKLPRGADTTKFDDMADKLEKLYQTHRKLMEGSVRDVRIEFFTDDLNYSGSRTVEWDEDDHVWELNNGLTRSTLREVLDWALENGWTYSATAEYEAAHPNWSQELLEDSSW